MRRIDRTEGTQKGNRGIPAILVERPAGALSRVGNFDGPFRIALNVGPLSITNYVGDSMTEITAADGAGSASRPATVAGPDDATCRATTAPPDRSPSQSNGVAAQDVPLLCAVNVDGRSGHTIT